MLRTHSYFDVVKRATRAYLANLLHFQKCTVHGSVARTPLDLGIEFDFEKPMSADKYIDLQFLEQLMHKGQKRILNMILSPDYENKCVFKNDDFDKCISSFNQINFLLDKKDK